MQKSHLPRAFVLSLFLLPTACNTGSSSGSSVRVPAGAVLEKPDQPGSLYIATEHQGGEATRLHVKSLFWGRLVNVHDLESDGSVDLDPVFRDFLVAPDLISNGVDYTIDTNPFTSETRLVIQREQGQPDTGNGTFEDLLDDLTRDLGPIHPMGLNGSFGTPASFVARNAALVIEFDDLLDDDAEAQRNLSQAIRVLTGYPTTTPFEARIVFDPSHGGVSGGKFHSTRVIVDFSVSALDAANHPTVLAENLLGLPQSLIGTNGVNIALRIPSRTEPSVGQFEILRNLKGSQLATTANGPTDPSSPTHDIVRGMRSGNEEDVSRGFLFDNKKPEIVSNWPLTVTRSVPDLSGDPTFEFTLDLVFTSTCQKAPAVGEVIRINSRVVEVTRNAGPPAIGSGEVKSVSVRAIDGRPIFNPGSLVGVGGYQAVFASGGKLSPACWVSFQPPARVFPSFQVPPDARVVLNFSEPMDTGTLRPFDTMRVYKGTIFDDPTATTSVVGTIQSSADLLSHAFAPQIGFDHVVGTAETYTLELAGGTDLGGNALATPLPRLSFQLDTAAPNVRAGGIVVRFADTNEYVVNDPTAQDDDFRGQMNYDLTRGIVTPRPVIRESWPMDQTTPAGSLMFPIPIGIPEPLSPMGSRLMTLWRNADLGWLVTDESKDNIDVEGVSWMPFGGAVVSDYFEDFELRLAHSSRLPDEFVDSTGLLLHPASGLLDAPSSFDDNVLSDPAGPKEIVHARGFGYRVDPNQSFVAATGTTMMPFPLNRGTAPKKTYTWRDTAIQAVGGASSAGVPQRFEVVDLGLYDGIGIGEIYLPGEVPSHGLPLLLDIACYPSNQGVGANEFTLAVGRFGQLFPTARVHSTGGHNTAGRRINKDPDTQMVPSGGFNPLSTPPGQPTRSGDPTFYFGQLDTVVRVSRAHSVWFDAQNGNPDWLGASVEPAAAEQPSGTQIELHYRGATGFTTVGGQQFRASLLNVYGDLPPGRVNFLNGDPSWTSNLDDLDGARYVQVRITFTNNIETGLSPTLDTLALAFAGR